MLSIYAIRNNKVTSYGTPMFVFNQRHAEENCRSFLYSKEASQIDPQDYDFYYLGKYDKQTATMELEENPKHLYNLQQIVDSDKRDNDQTTSAQGDKALGAEEESETK